MKLSRVTYKRRNLEYFMICVLFFLKTYTLLGLCDLRFSCKFRFWISELAIPKVKAAVP